MIGLGVSIAAFRPMQSGEAPKHSFVFAGQSQNVYLTSYAAFYRNAAITFPTIVTENLTVYNLGTGGQLGAAVTKVAVNNTTIAAGQVNPAMAALSVFLAYARPGHQFAIAADVIAGTSRYAWSDNANTDRRVSDSAALIAAVRTDFEEVDHHIECWQVDDASSAKTHHDSFAPIMFGQTSGGATHTLGTANASAANATAIVNNCWWDGDATLGTKGRGLYERGTTKLHLLGWPASSVGSTGTEDRNSTRTSAGASRGVATQLDQPARDQYRALFDQAVALETAGTYGPSMHSALMNTTGGTHPIVDDPEGQIDLMWSLAVAVLAASGRDISAPYISGISAAGDGSWARVHFTLPNGGELSTKRIVRGQSFPGTPSPHQHEVTGFELTRVGQTDDERRFIFRADSGGGYPDSHKATITIDGDDVLIIPVEPFEEGDIIDFGRGDASLRLDRDRDAGNRLYRDLPIEHIPSLYSPTATHKFPGVNVETQPDAMVLELPAIVAPILSGVSVAKTTTTATVSWSTNEGEGTAYMLVDTNATRTAAQITPTGQQQTITASGAQADFVQTGLDPETAYYSHLVHIDSEGGVSLVTNTGFTTDALPDVTGPTLSGISVNKTDTTASLNWSTNEGNGTAYALFDQNATRTAAQIISGGDSLDISGSGSQTPFPVTGLTASTGYYAHLVHRDAAGNDSTISDTSFTTDAEADVTAPTLSSATDAKDGETAMTGGVTTNEDNGTLYWVVSTSATAPTKAQVKAGQTHAGVSASASGSQSITTTGAKTISASGLTGSTAYYAHFMHEDAAANQSDVASADGFTTDAPAAPAFATRGSSDTAYLTGPVLASGTEAITFELDFDMDDGGAGFVELVEYTSTTFKASLDTRAIKRGLQFYIEDGAGTAVFANVVTADAVLPAGRHTLVVSASLDSDGSGAALLRAWVDDVLVYTSPVATAAVKTFATSRSLEVLRQNYAGKFYSMNIYAGTHAQGYTSDGDTSGLTLLHSVSGAAANWNTPGGTLVKAGAASFT